MAALANFLPTEEAPRSLWLDAAEGNLQEVWQLQSGWVDIFAVDSASGVRHFLIRLEQGETLSTFAWHKDARFRLLAIPAPGSSLLRSNRHEVINLCQERLMQELDPARAIDRSTLLPEFVAAVISGREKAAGVRFAEKADAAGLKLEKVFARLAQTLPGEAEHAGDSGAALFLCCQAIGNVLGVHFVEPQPTGGTETSIQDIARASSVRYRRVTLPARWWTAELGPLLAFQNGLPVSLLPRSAGGYQLFDPHTTVLTQVDELLAVTLNPVAFCFCRPLPGRLVTKGQLLLFALRGCGPDLRRVAWMGCFTGCMGLLVPIFTGMLAGQFIPMGDRRQITTLLAVLLVGAVSAALFSYSGALALQRAGVRAGAQVQIALWDRILNLPASFFRQYSSSEIALRAMSMDVVRDNLAGPILFSGITGVFAIWQLFMLFYFSSRLAVPATILLAALGAALIVCSAPQAGIQRSLCLIETKLSDRVFQFINGISRLRVAGAEPLAFATWATEFIQQRRAFARSRQLAILLSSLHTMTPLLGWMVVVGFTMGSDSAAIGPGKLIAFSASFQQLLGATLQLGAFLTAVGKITPIIERVEPILQAVPEVSPASRHAGQLNGRIEVKNLTFRYRPSEQPVLRDISFSIEPGQFVAFAGATGTGKSTLLRILLGFETAERGAVLYDDQNLATIAPCSVRSQLGVVLQSGGVLAGDIASNIVGSCGLSLDAAWEAARLVGLDQDIRAMPMGMYTPLSDGGGGLSGGQRQRLLIARALVARPKIVLFDEATSALDNRTQATITEALNHLNATRVVIAHRLSTIRRADRVFVLHQGAIAESGTFDALIAKRGRFFDLAQRQEVFA